MDKTAPNIEEIYEDLIDNLIEAFVFYVPMELIDEVTLNHIEGKIEDDFFNNAHVVLKGSFGDGDLTEFQKIQYEKVVLLEKTFFRFLSLEKELSEVEFQILITKYLDYVEFMTSISKWLLDNLETYNEVKGDIDAFAIFNTQYNQLYNHLVELFKVFAEKYKYESKEYYSLEEFIGKYLPDFVGRYTKFVEKFPFEEDSNAFIETTKINKPTQEEEIQKKQELITESVAEEFLLETVFNVKINK